MFDYIARYSKNFSNKKIEILSGFYLNIKHLNNIFYNMKLVVYLVKNKEMNNYEKIKDWFLRIALRFIVWYSKDSNYIKHAKKEFEIAWGGDKKSEDVDENCMQDYMCNQVIELLSVLSTQGDSGSSIGYKLNLFKRLANFKVISPLTFNDDEFVSCSDGIKQNKRDSRVFMNKDGKFNFIDDYICKEKYYIGEQIVVGQRDHGCTFNGGVFVIRENGDIYHIRKGYIKDIHKFNPEPIYIDVYSIEFPRDWWLSLCKESQLEEYLKNYSIDEDHDTIERELNLKDGKYRSDIINRIECAGKHMYGESFTINIK